jgi:hypothetical protein
MIAVKRLAIRLVFADGHPEVVKLVIVPAAGDPLKPGLGLRVGIT